MGVLFWKSVRTLLCKLILTLYRIADRHELTYFTAVVGQNVYIFEHFP
jgi:hypothetical protein